MTQEGPDRDRPFAAIVLAAGRGVRMRSARPKVMHPIAGLPMIAHVVAAVRSASPQRIVVVLGPDMEEVAAAVHPCETAVQAEARGTADAVAAARAVLGGFEGDVMVVFGDTPMLSARTIATLLAARRGAGDPAVAVAAMRPVDPGEYGRVVMGGDGGVERIVEWVDATGDERAIGLCNGGLMAFDGGRLWPLIDAVAPSPTKGELYMTDTVSAARERGWRVVAAEIPEADILGINSRAQLAGAEAAMQARLRAAAFECGVTMTDPATVFLSADTVFGRDVTIGPFVQFGPGVVVEDDVEIRAFSHVEGARIASGAVIGPHARLRPGAEIGPGAHIGNFVEVKAARIGAGAKANHLSYVGDASVGPRSNLGAGTITCNYDGFLKHRTEIGADVFVGSHTALVAPVTVGDGAVIGAGAVVTEDIPPGASVLARAPQSVREGGGERLRARKAAAAAAARRERE